MRTISDYPSVVVVFGMHGCPACEAYIPVFRKVATTWAGRVPAFVVDANQQEAAANFYQIADTPTTLVLRYGSIVGHPLIGLADPAAVDEMFRLAANWV